jgi:hypothetical protein
MAMKFVVEQKGQMFLVVNETTGYVKGRFKEKGEAEKLSQRLQKEHNEGIEAVSHRITPKQQDPLPEDEID